MRSSPTRLGKVGRWVLEVIGLWLLACIGGTIIVYLKHGKQGLIDHPLDAELALWLLVLAVFYRVIKIPLWNGLFDRILARIPPAPSVPDLIAPDRTGEERLSRDLRAARRRTAAEKRERDAEEARRAKEQAKEAAFDASKKENRRRFGPTGNEIRVLNRRFEHLVRLPSVIQ